jgi:hypothetical protein
MLRWEKRDFLRKGKLVVPDGAAEARESAAGGKDERGALGDRRPPRMLIGRVLGPMVKKKTFV